MADSKDHIGKPDQSRVPGSEEYEVRRFAEAIGLDVEKVRKLIERHGEGETMREGEARKPTNH